MPNLVFIDVQDQSGHSRSRVKRHVAKEIQKKKRLAEITKYHNVCYGHEVSNPEPIADDHRPPIQALVGCEDVLAPPSSTHTETSLPVNDRTEKDQKDRRKREKMPLMLRWRVGVPQKMIPRGDDLQIEFVLTQSCNWMFGQYTYPWSVLIKQDPTVYDQNNRIEIFREAFYIVSDLLSLQKVDAAFRVLKCTLDSVPDLFRDSHPEILFSLVELASGINMPGADSLHTKVKIHVADIAGVVLGDQHPLSILLKSEFDIAPRAYVTELVFKCIIDALSKTFGRTAYQTLVQQMGRSQFYARTGRDQDGQRLISDIMREWQAQYGSNSVLARLAELELNLMRLQACRERDPSVEAQTNNAMLRIEVVSGVYSNKFTEEPSSEEMQLDRSSRALALAHWFLLKKRYTFALHVYGRQNARLEQHQISKSQSQGPSLADEISDIVQDALFDVLSCPSDISVLPSHASIKDDFRSSG
ncbi:uncharacterized protein A1O9_01355 [Exophiala aquamarina CBS 119918]|uniref:Clr5 domain-containing protein n=1 Tax=Exophiala aquamarina CBS 119918 TaxID=1182545 RepID=A0A072PVL8_9EURO|nr:uncharacterized protein A1O9_01355 [Exophiala aquamarina CBS 119918]KEF63378.1 hypothetical protein A1O9_01355 [Exophiala aquamarina CBS 119918]